VTADGDADGVKFGYNLDVLNLRLGFVVEYEVVVRGGLNMALDADGTLELER
jgi:hypothetical protein